MTMAIVGVVLNILMSLWCISLGADPTALGSFHEAAVYSVFGLIGLGSCAVAVIGLIMASSEKNRKIGSILVIVGSVIFVPLGLIAVFGAIKMKKPLEQRENDEDFEARRLAHLEKKKNTEATNQNFDA